MSDEAIVRRLNLLNMPEGISTQVPHHIQALEHLYAKIQSESKWQQFITTLDTMKGDARKRFLANTFIEHSADEQNFKKFESVLFVLSKKDVALKNEIIQFFKETLAHERARKQKIFRGFLFKEVNMLISILE